MTNFTLVQHLKTPTHHYYLRFGCPVETIIQDKAQILCAFSPGQFFGYVRWFRNEYGTRSWQLYICQTVDSGRVSHIPGVRPGAQILFRARGKTAVQQALSYLKSLEHSQNIPLENIPASFWRKAQNNSVIRQSLPIYAAK